MADAGRGPQLERWLGIGATVIAPATLLSALLFYFGYVSARAQYAYFGVDVDTIGLSTQDYVMRSPQPLLFPLLALTLLGLAGVRLHVEVRRRLAAAVADPATAAAYVRRVRWATRSGWLLVMSGALLLVGYGGLREWTAYPLLTPLVLAAGAATVAYARRIEARLAPPDPAAADLRALRRVVGVFVLVVVVVSTFWVTATLAQWSGRGLAHHDATHLGDLPAVILDTTERLYVRDPGVEETALPAGAEQRFRYRYRNLRLLIQGGEHMFLVAETWSPSNATLVVPMDGAVRVRFQFRNDPP